MNLSSLLEMILRFLLAVVLGAGIGFQRERAGKAAGLRTHILVSAGAGLFTLVSIYGFSGAVVDISRVAAGVVVGIGFIGAGVILRGQRQKEVAGLTTAATIWITAAVGLAAGAGMYVVSVIATAVAVGVLFLPKVRG
ncbi:MAG: MgtC/SapB family protein [Dehalococcoidia bacterium]|nr:MgtC/SapB family protein [Dehalococcoidia bacterium]MDH4291438.1 MgtC/SapB family protein [Dehalococcoidia bacterium]